MVSKPPRAVWAIRHVPEGLTPPHFELYDPTGRLVRSDPRPGRLSNFALLHEDADEVRHDYDLKLAD